MCRLTPPRSKARQLPSNSRDDETSFNSPVDIGDFDGHGEARSTLAKNRQPQKFSFRICAKNAQRRAATH